ncbi:MAG: 30S ribosomal protein S16 [Flavobacteriaceae bacterium]|nr:30S ribosomal protein S16 [Flavobacteriaceae bacterium]
MPVRIRLQRHGKKGKPFYWIVASDSRAKRDGRYLEKLGVYDPNTNPATVEIKIDASLKWLQNGAQPSDTARTLLSYRGIMLKHHLNGGIRKGALTEEEANEKFESWLDDKNNRIQSKIDSLSSDKAKKRAKALAHEKDVNIKRIAEIKSALEAAAEAPKEEAAAAEAPKEEVAAAAEAPKEEVAAAEAPKEEAAAAEAPKEEAAEKEDDLAKKSQNKS